MGKDLIKISEVSKPIRSKFFGYLGLDEDEYRDIELSDKQMIKLRRYMSHLSTGSSAAIPLSCVGPRCPFRDRCILLKMDREEKEGGSKRSIMPLGKPCPIEVNLLNEWTKLYLEEYDVDPDSFTEFGMCRELAEIELLLWRIDNGLARPENADMVQENAIGQDKEGNVIYRKEISNYFEIKERLFNRKSKIIKNLVGDRQEKYKREAALKIKSESDASSQMSSIRRGLEQLQNQVKQLEGNAITPDDLLKE